MGTIHADVILGKARKILNDAGAGTWTNQDLLDFYNTGQRTIVSIDNTANIVTTNHTTVAGTKQTITGFRLIAVKRNMGAAGTTPGTPITKMDGATLDSFIPNWHTLTTVDDAKHYVTSEDDTVFYLYPPIKADRRVEIVQSVAPADVLLANIATADLTIDDGYEGAMIDYILWRAFSFLAELPGMDARAQQHKQDFYAAVGMDAQAADIKADSSAQQRKK